MKWQGLFEFVTVAQTESFTQAAKRLNLSTAQVSRQISSLEARLNTKLFYRTTRKVTLTEEGQLFFAKCTEVFDKLDEAQEVLTAGNEQPRGLIRLTAPVTYGEKIILPLTTAFACRYEQVSINAHLSNQQLNLVEQGFDLAIRIGELMDSNLMAKKLSQRQTFFCACQTYLQKHGEPKNPGQLADHNCLLGTLDYWQSHFKGKTQKLRVSGNLRYNSGTALLDAALQGIGIVQLPDFYVNEAIKDGRLTVILSDYQPLPENIWAVYPYNRQLSNKVRYLIDFLKDAMQNNAFAALQEK